MTDETPVSEAPKAQEFETRPRVLPLPGMTLAGWAECTIDLTAYGWGTVLIRDPSLFATAAFLSIANSGASNLRIAASLVSTYFVKGDSERWPTRGAPLSTWEKYLADCPSKPVDALVAAIRRFREMFAEDVTGPN